MTSSAQIFEARTPLRRLRVLVAGFQDFDADSDGTPNENPTKRVPDLASKHFATLTVPSPSGDVFTASVDGVVLDVTWSRDPTDDSTVPAGAADVLHEQVKSRRPDVVLVTGMLARRTTFSVTTTASDADKIHGSIAMRIIGADGSPAYYRAPDRNQYTKGPGTAGFELSTSLPVEAIQRAWAQRQVPYEDETSAGQYICNDVFYRLLWLRTNTAYGRSVLRGGFIHVPEKPTDDQLVTAVRAALEATLASIRPEEIDPRA